MTKTIYTPSDKAKAIRNLVASKHGEPMTFGQIANEMPEKIGTATVKALVDNGYLEISKVEDVICPCCGHKKKDVKFYIATEKAI